MTRATVITDASFCATTGAGGWAAWVRLDTIKGPVKQSGCFHERQTSSTFAEVYAALNGIWIARALGATEILLQSDCMTVKHLRDGRCKSPGLVKAWTEALGREDMAGIKVSVRHVKGHNYHRTKDARTFVNDWCDRKAKEHMVMQRGQV